VNPAQDRYTDRHVREDVSLIDVAEGYAQAYTGDFEFMVDIRDRLRDGQRLTVTQVRGVLNCMRHDPRVGHLPVPASGGGARVIRLPAHLMVAPPGDDESRRPPYVDAAVRWKKTYLLSHHRSAQVIHHLDARRSYVRFHRGGNRSRPRIVIQTVCGTHWYDRQPGFANLECITAAEATALVTSGVWRPCRRCEVLTQSER